MTSVGVIGFGSFGEFLVRKLTGTARVTVYDPHKQVPHEYSTDLPGVVDVDYLVLAVPFASYDQVLTSVKSLLRPHTTIVDISSVKSLPVEKLEVVLPDQKKVITHPLFGPQSAEESFDGHTLVMCPSVSSPEQYARIKHFCESLGIKVEEMTPEEHDKEMALVHALTFFVARSVLRMDVHFTKLVTPSFRKLIDLADLEAHHSEELFRTIQLANPYAMEVREAFIKTVRELNDSLS